MQCRHNLKGGAKTMKFKNTISILVLSIMIFSLIASAYGVFSNEGPGEHEFTSLQGLTVSIYGKGLYANESVAMAVQARAQDGVTLFLGIPLLFFSLFLTQRNLLKGKLLLTGTLGYFLYTYTVYTFIAMYSSFFLLFVLLMSLSFFAFIFMMMSFDMEEIRTSFNEKLPFRFVSGFLLFLSAAVGLMWLGKIVPPLFNGTVPLGLDHYTTLVVQTMDLGIIIPSSVIGALLLLKRKPLGYLLSAVISFKIITLLTALTAMIISQAMAGVQMNMVEMTLFPIFNILAIYTFVLILKNIKENRYREYKTPKIG